MSFPLRFRRSRLRGWGFPFVTIVLFVLHTLRTAADDNRVPIGGGGDPRDVNAAVPAADLARLKMHPPFMGMTDANVQQKIIKMRQALLDIIEAIRAENPKIADCLQKQFDANRINIDFANPRASAGIRHDRQPECNAEPIDIGVTKLPCDRLPLYDPLITTLISTLLHEGLHGTQDFRPTPDAPFPPVTDDDKAKAFEALHCREMEASAFQVQVACELIAVLEALAAGNPIPPNARGVAKRIGEAIANHPTLTADEKRAAAAKLLADQRDLKTAYQQIADCRAEHKRAYRDFIDGKITKARLNEILAANTWFQIYGGIGGLGPNKIAYMGDGKSNHLKQVGNGLQQEFALAGVDRLFAMELMPGGTKAVFIGDEMATGDGVVLGYSDTNGDGFFEPATRQELFRSNDLAGGVHLARNPVNNDLMVLKRKDNTLLRLKDANADQFPDGYETAGGFDSVADGVLYLRFSADGKTAYAQAEFDPQLGGVLLPHDLWAVANASAPGGEFQPAASVRGLTLQTIAPAFEAEPLAGQSFVWANAMPSTQLELHRVIGATNQLIAQIQTDANGRAILPLESPLITGHQLQLRDPQHALRSELRIVSMLSLDVSREAGDLWLRWPGRAVRLEASPSLGTGFTSVAQAVSPFRLVNPVNAGFFRLRLLFGLAARPIETPCPEGVLSVQQAYSECQEDGFWHVVEDDYYFCPPNNTVLVRYRVLDTKTEQKCTEAMDPPSAASIGPPLVDPTCQSPVDTKRRFVLMTCTNGHWAEATYLIFRCLDGSLRLSGPVANVPANPATRCSERPPPPQPP